MMDAHQRQRSQDTHRHRPRLEALGGGLLHGLIMVLAFPGVGAWALVVFAPLPLIFVATRASALGRSPFRTGVLAGLGTLPMWLFEHQWIAEMTALGLVPLGFVLSVYPGVFVWFLARIRRRWAGLPVWVVAGPLWMAIEFFRGSLIFDGYPWLLVGHPLIEFTPLAMPARWFGMYVVSMLCVTVSAVAYEAIVGRRVRAVLVLGGLAVVWGGLALAPSGTRPDPQRTLAIGLIQTNVPQSVRGTWPLQARVEEMVELDRMTRAASAQIGDRTPSVIVWPETMFPGYFLDEQSLAAVAALDDRAAGFREQALAIARATIDLERSVAPPLLVGVVAHDSLRFELKNGLINWTSDKRFNSSLLFDDGRQVARYDKVFLTPFGEVMPYISAWPWLEKKLLSYGAKGMTFDLAAGERPVRFEVGDGVRVATPICFEATMPGVCRRLVFERGERRAEVLINMTNDGWFGRSHAGRRLHLLGARWRCVELATPMVRSANTGISCLIDASGTVVSRMPIGERAYLVVQTPIGRGVTLFARIGHTLPWAALIGAILLLGTTYFGDRGPKNADAHRQETSEGERS